MLCLQGKGEMETYWLVREDLSRRLERLQAVLADSISSERKYISF